MKKIYRIKKNTEIEKLVKYKISYGNKYFAIFKNNTINETNNFRFCVSVSKKYGNAVHRNKMKRRVRSIIRNNKDKFLPYDFLIVCKPTSSTFDFKEINSNLLYLLKKLNLLKNKEDKKNEKN